MSNMWAIEQDFYQKGYSCICGVDEAGRGPLAGPVCAAAVILPPNLDLPGLNDSKKLSEKKRNALYEQIKNKAIAFLIKDNRFYFIFEVHLYLTFPLIP